MRRTTGASSADSFSSKTSTLAGTSSSPSTSSTSAAAPSISETMSAMPPPLLSYERSMAWRIAAWEATTGTTWRLVMNPTSSSAKTLVGSPMASVSWLPWRLMGRTSYLRAICSGTSLSTSGSMSSWESVIDWMPYCRDRNAISFSSVTKLSLTRMEPSLSLDALLLLERARQLVVVDQPLADEEIAEAPADGLYELGLFCHWFDSGSHGPLQLAPVRRRSASENALRASSW